MSRTEVEAPLGPLDRVFFYDGPISRAVAFEGLLASGERFAHAAGLARSREPDGDRLVHIATDGETYGHHHRYGEMALAYALHHIEANGLARLTNYGEFLAAHPPEQEVEIVENTSWSCAHGVERWRSDCGCNTGGEPGWNQAWRAPLREALDWLRDELAPRFESRGAARSSTIPGRRATTTSRDPRPLPENVPLLRAPCRRSDGRSGRALKLLEMQRHAMLMYTSCGWFFDDLAGSRRSRSSSTPAGRCSSPSSSSASRSRRASCARLEKARSNVPETGNGRDLYEKHVRPAMVDLPQVAAHYAVSSLFQDYPNPARVYCYAVERQNGRTFQAGRARLRIGKARVTSSSPASRTSWPTACCTSAITT